MHRSEGFVHCRLCLNPLKMSYCICTRPKRLPLPCEQRSQTSALIQGPQTTFPTFFPNFFFLLQLLFYFAMLISVILLFFFLTFFFIFLPFFLFYLPFPCLIYLPFFYSYPFLYFCSFFFFISFLFFFFLCFFYFIFCQIVFFHIQLSVGNTADSWWIHYSGRGGRLPGQLLNQLFTD